MKGRRQLLTVVGLVGAGALILVAGLFLVILPQHSKIGKLHTQFEETQTQILSIEATRAGSQSVGASQLYELSRAMPPTDDMPGVLLDLSRAAAASQTTVMSVRPSADITLPDGSVAVPLQVVVDGKFAGIARFLGNLRRAVSVRGSDVHATSRLFLVDNVGISANTTSTGTAAPASGVTATLALVAFDYSAQALPSLTIVAPGSSGGSASSATAAAAPAGGN
jgi:Tfp pilus assembly protein PilO